MKIKWDDVPAEQLSADRLRRQLDLGSFYLARHEYEPGYERDWHAHPESQFGHVLEGSMQIWIEDEMFEQAAGESIFIASGLTHKMVVPSEKTVVLNLYIKPND
jgi:quercetin dioxygenase-like cupin family protein